MQMNRSSLFAAEEGDGAQLPLDGRCHALVRVLRGTWSFGLEVAPEDEVLIVSLGVLVDWAEVGSLGQVRQVLLTLGAHTLWLVFVYGRGDGGHVQDWELVVELLWL